MDGDGIQVIARAAAVLRALRDAPSGLSLGALSERTGLPRSTVQRIVAALRRERLVLATAEGARLGPEVQALAAAARLDVPGLARPHLLAVARGTGETVDLSVLRGGRMVFLDQVPGSHRLRAVSAVGEAFPLATTANGRAVLSLMAPGEARRLLEAEGATDWESLSVRLADGDGLACDAGEHTPGISALGFAVLAPTGEAFAVSVPVPTARWAEAQGAVRAALVAARGALRADLGA